MEAVFVPAVLRRKNLSAGRLEKLQLSTFLAGCPITEHISARQWSIPDLTWSILGKERDVSCQTWDASGGLAGIPSKQHGLPGWLADVSGLENGTANLPADAAGWPKNPARQPHGTILLWRWQNKSLKNTEIILAKTSVRPKHPHSSGVPKKCKKPKSKTTLRSFGYGAS
jgi:hypothetical protein